MAEGQNGNFEKGRRPSSGELQARAAEKIIEDVQRKSQAPIRGIEGSASSPMLPVPTEQSDKARLDDIRRVFGEANAEEPRKRKEDDNHNPFAPTNEFFESLKQWKQRISRTHDKPQTDRYRYPRIITPHGVATNPEELDKLFELKRKESDENLERQRKEAAARLNTFKRLPFLEKLSMLLSGTVVDQEMYDEILAQEKMKLRLDPEK
jgi:hypothetical protein